MVDYLAVITTPYGGGSFARSTGKESKVEVAQRCRRIFIADWQSLFKLKKGAKLKANVIDVTDLDRVSWDESGFYHETDQGRVLLDRPIEVVEV